MGQNSIMSVLLMMSIAWQSIGTPLPDRHIPTAVRPDINKPVNIEKKQKIVGGIEITPHVLPSLVLIVVGEGEGAYIHCAGSIIDESHVLSAAHCFENPNLSYIIVAGQHNYTTWSSEQIVLVDKIVLHPSYNASWISHDIAILKLSRPLQMNSRIQASDLNNDRSCPKAGTYCMVVGWGDTQFNGTSSEVPLVARVRVHSDQNCSSYSQFYGDDKLCAGQEGANVCSGDSGGPLLCFCEREKMLAGVVSYGYGCGSKGHPGFYTKVSYFTNWISETIPIM